MCVCVCVHLHVSQQLEDLHGAQDNVLDRLLADATQRRCVDIPGGLGLLPTEWRGGHKAGRYGRGCHGDGKSTRK